MASINVSDTYTKWIQNNVIPALEGEGVTVTLPAQNLLAYALQAQLDDKLVPDDKILFKGASDLMGVIPSLYKGQYGKQQMNFNRALHALVNANQLLRIFPWTPTI